MSLVHYDDFYEICCQSCVSSDDKAEPTIWKHTKTGKQMEIAAEFQQDMIEDHLYEKV
jgi:hypothetical protein